MSNKVLVIIPAYNEERNLDRVVEDICKNCPAVDYIIVNDCSRDGTLELCRNRGYPHLNLGVNLGFSGAVQTGYKYALANGYEIAVQFDGDGQHPADRIAALINPIKLGTADYVLGSRFVEKAKPWTTRMLGSRILAMNLNFIAEPDTVTRAILAGTKVVEIQVDMRERSEGVSHFARPINTVKYMVRIILSILFLQGGEWK